MKRRPPAQRRPLRRTTARKRKGSLSRVTAAPAAQSGSPAAPWDNVGVWLIGAYGGLATTLMVGARMLSGGLVSSAGLLSETPALAEISLPPVGQLIFGGHDVRNTSLWDSAYEIYRDNGSFDLEKLQSIRGELAAMDDNIRTGTCHDCGPTIRGLSDRAARRSEGPLDIIQRIKSDITEFQARHNLSRVIVVNIASTEPPLSQPERFETLPGLRRLLSNPRPQSIPASVLYGYAAADLGLPLINFTPNQGFLVPAIQTLARQRGVPFMGNDGKTGETLVKSALAPMFKYRNLRVLTWQGYNILGDRDGQVLADPENKRAKIRSKDGVLSHILGYPLHTHVGIDYVPSLKDQKTAWDFIHFQGFLDYKMNLQFTWQGCDAILAAPVVLDMIRLTASAHAQGQKGLMTWLSCFFKSPLGVDEHDLHFQFHHLMDYVHHRRDSRPWPVDGLVAKEGEIHFPVRPASK